MTKLDREKRILLAIGALLAIVVNVPRAAPLELAVLAVEWVLLTLAMALGDRAASLAFAAAALAATTAWLAHPAAWLLGLAMLGIAWVVRRLGDPKPASDARFEVIATAIAVLAPAALSGVVIGLGGQGASVMRAELAEALPRYGLARAALASCALAVWVSLCIARGMAIETPALRRFIGLVVGCGLVLLTVVRGRWMLSVLSFPTELQWSEAPILFNAYKLELGHRVYGPLEDCNSYSYSPLLELVHRAALSPFGKNLSLTANRWLGLVWHGLSAAALAWAFRGVRDRWRRPAEIGLSIGIGLTVTSSFLAANLHPDHLTILGFCLAIVVVVAERKIPRTLFAAGLLLLPAFCTMAKLTGAGIGLGLLFAFAWPFRLREVALLAGGGALALSTIPLFNATLGPFSTYAISLQASHPIRWGDAGSALHSPEGRVFLASLGALALAALTARGSFGARLSPGAQARLQSAVSDGLRLALLTAAFLTPSLAAFLKVGGRANSLVPMTIGGAAILVRLACAAPSAVQRVILAPAGLSLLIRVAPPEVPMTRADASAAERRLDDTVAMIRQELSEGRRTLFYGGTLAWIAAGSRAVPLDRWQTVEELVLGGRPEVEAFHDRLRSGYYRSVIVGAHVLSPRYSRDATVLRAILTTHFRQMTPSRTEDEGQPLLFRFGGAGEAR